MSEHEVEITVEKRGSEGTKLRFPGQHYPPYWNDMAKESVVALLGSAEPGTYCLRVERVRRTAMKIRARSTVCCGACGSRGLHLHNVCPYCECALSGEVMLSDLRGPDGKPLVEG